MDKKLYKDRQIKYHLKYKIKYPNPRRYPYNKFAR